MTDFARLFAYDRWANNETLRALMAIAAPPERAVKVMAHIIGAQYVWYARMTATPNDVPVWPDWTVERSAAVVDPMANRWVEIVQRGGDFFGLEFSYTNTKGEKWTSRNDDVLMHVIMHSAYHRGQIAAAIRASGNQPPYTDYIQAARAGLLA